MPNILYPAIAAAGGTLVTMHRLADEDGDPLTQADIESITYTVSEVRPDGTLEANDDHEDEALDVEAVIFDTLQTGAPWDTSEDAIGYNFRHTIDISAAAAFPYWGRRYMVVYTVALVTGPPIVWRWTVRTPAAS